jgi:hypothetical protein
VASSGLKPTLLPEEDTGAAGDRAAAADAADPHEPVEAVAPAHDLGVPVVVEALRLRTRAGCDESSTGDASVAPSGYEQAEPPAGAPQEEQAGEGHEALAALGTEEPVSREGEPLAGAKEQAQTLPDALLEARSPKYTTAPNEELGIHLEATPEELPPVPPAHSFAGIINRVRRGLSGLVALSAVLDRAGKGGKKAEPPAHQPHKLRRLPDGAAVAAPPRRNWPFNQHAQQQRTVKEKDKLGALARLKGKGKGEVVGTSKDDAALACALEQGPGKAKPTAEGKSSLWSFSKPGAKAPKVV